MKDEGVQTHKRRERQSVSGLFKGIVSLPPCLSLCHFIYTMARVEIATDNGRMCLVLFVDTPST